MYQTYSLLSKVVEKRKILRIRPFFSRRSQQGYYSLNKNSLIRTIFVFVNYIHPLVGTDLKVPSSDI